jgi:oligoribonuclease NrnB/cAMP/cGMP phosphodiesterase (DHH superfamily)
MAKKNKTGKGREASAATAQIDAGFDDMLAEVMTADSTIPVSNNNSNKKSNINKNIIGWLSC